jgi:acyl-coenzyme A thioesterase PaaI-like protein
VPGVTDDGMERLRRWRDEDRGVPPAVGRLAATLVSVERGATRVRLPLTAELRRAGGEPTGAVSCLLADFGLTTCVISSLPDLRGVTTISMTVDHVAPAPVEGGLHADCRAATHAGDGPAYAAGSLRDDDGREVARVAGWLMPTPADALSADRVGLVHEPPARDLLDLLHAGPGPEFELVARDALSNAIGSLHGGIGALASQLAAETALGTGVRPLTSTFAFLRPTPRDGSVSVRGSVVRRGRRTGTATADLVDPEGRLVLRASLSAALGG